MLTHLRLHWLTHPITLLCFLLLLGGPLAYIDHALHLETMLVETVHALAVTSILIVCILAQIRHPEIKTIGWQAIILGLALLTIGSWVDLLDDPPAIAWLHIMGVPFGRSWQQAFIKKILGYTGGVTMMAIGFSQWLPWMIQTRLSVERLNQRLSQANQNMNRILINRDERVEAERLNISRELHDDVAQQLTALGIQIQLCQKQLAETGHSALPSLQTIRQDLSETLQRVRDISRDLRPESLYSLGLVPALEQFFEKLRHQWPQTPTCTLQVESLAESDPKHQHWDSALGDRQKLHLFRILQEGIRNAVKHAQASHITVLIREQETTFVFQVQDNGRGFPWEDMPQDTDLVQRGHLGLVGLKERVAELGGSVRFYRQADQTIMEVLVQK